MFVFTALADPNRLRILEMLAERGRMAAGQICRQFTISPPAVSQHLKVLKKANLVRVEVKAQQRIYTLNDSGISQLEAWTAKMRRSWNERFDALDALLEEELMKIREGEGRKTHEPPASPANDPTQ